MVQLLPQWIHWKRRWRALRHQYSVTPWVFLTVSLVAQQASAYHHHPYPPPPPSHHPPPMYAQQYQNPQAQPQPHSLLTGPSATPPAYFYTIDGGNKLVQRQMQPGPSGITSAATNYLLQQIEIERQQQTPHQRSILPQQPPPQSHHQQHQNNALQMLANLTPQQLSALQSVLPTLPRSGLQQMASAATSNNMASAVAVLPPGGGPDNFHPHPQSSFASRMGPFDKLFNKAKSWLPDMMSSGSSQSGGNGVGEPKMRDLHRLPKPPQYPLYDLPSMATPPPAPIMHPMASLPNSAFDLDQPPMAPPMQSSSPRSAGSERLGASSFNQHNWMSPSPTMSTSRKSPHHHRPSAQRPPKPSRPSFFKNPLGRSHKKPRPSQEPPQNYNRRNHGPGQSSSGRRPPPRDGPRQSPRPSLTNKPKKNSQQKGRYQSSGRRPSPQGPISDPFGATMGFDHPMASNLSPAQSPALGRPLSYDEYMARPSHSYTDDPWNFDPFANQMNQGLHTSALRYNYDPLGMNALDTEANSHLDPNKLSYPGDAFNQDMVKDSPGLQGIAQIGGWDKPFKKRPYSDPESDLTPPGVNNGFGNGGSSFSSSPNDPYAPPSSLGSSSKRYKNSGSSSSNSGGSGFLTENLSGGRRGEIPSMDPFEGGSAMPSFGEEQGNRDEAPTIDLESLQSQDDDGMSGLEFTLETSLDKDTAAAGSHMSMADTPHSDSHPLGPMQPAANPYLSDQYSPYGEQSAPESSSVPGTPYGPGGYTRQRERYGRRRTRNNHGQGQTPVGRRSLRTRAQKQRAVSAQISQPASVVPEGVQIFNEIIRPQLVQSSSSQSHPQHAAVRRQLYNAIRQSARK